MAIRKQLALGFLLVIATSLPGWSTEVTTWASSLTPPATPIQVYPRTQCHKYWHFQNYLHWWKDRPLKTDRSLRPAVVDGQLVTPGSDVAAVKASMIRDAELAKLYQVDGMGSFASTWYQEPSYEVYLDALAGAGTVGYKHYMEIGIGNEAAFIRPALAKALASPFSAKLNGKVLISSYELDKIGPDAIAAMRQALLGEFGSTFVLVVEMSAVTADMQRLYRSGQLSTSPSATLDGLKQALRLYLNAADGIMVESVHHMEDVTAARYDNRFDIGFYKNCLIPIFKSVLAEPAYTGKLLGLGVAAGYPNNRTGDNNSEECTRRLRYTFEAAINAAPNFIIMPEWNEQNENTSLQPTIINGWTHRRITEYYMRTIKGLPLAAREGDDTALPNCIVSYRKELKLGETLEIELLNVPDSTSTAAYTATLSLENTAGTVVKTFAPVSFTRNVLRDHTRSVGSETLAASAILRPVLTIQQSTAPMTRTYKDGLLHVAVRPTWTQDYQTVKQPLRDLATLGTATLQITSTSGRDVVLTGTVNASEPLDSVEIMADGDEVYGYDRLNEYDLANNLVVSGYYTTLPGGYDCDLSVANSTFQFKQVFMPEGLLPYQKIGNTIRFGSAERNREWPARFYLLIPKASQNAAVINITFSKGSFSVRVADLLTHGVYSKTPVAQLIFRFEVFHALADHPVPINATSASFTTTIRATTDRPTYHLRINTQSGRTYRTGPLPVALVAASSSVSLPVFAESQGGNRVTVAVPRNDILDLIYEFDARCGDVLPVSAGPRWFAQLGGGTLYADPFYNSNGGYPLASGPPSNPSRVAEDGAPSLRFSGNGQYLVLPTESFPRGAFTLSFDVKPMATTPQVLFRHHGILIGSLMLRLANGKLYASHIGKPDIETNFDTGLTVASGQWNRIMVTYDLANLSFLVNTQPVKTYAFSGKALYFSPSAFGGHLRVGTGVQTGDGFFNGFLKSLRITHAANLPPVANTAPVANGQAVSTSPATARNLVLTGSDANGDVLTAAVVTSPLNGTLTGTAPAVVYTPNAGFLGSDSFTFTVNDGQVTSAPATIAITVVAGGSGSGSGGTPSVNGSGGGGGGGCGAGGNVAVAFLLGLSLLGLHRNGAQRTGSTRR